MFGQQCKTVQYTTVYTWFNFVHYSTVYTIHMVQLCTPHYSHTQYTWFNCVEKKLKKI